MRRIALLLVFMNTSGCGTLTVTRRFENGQPPSIVNYSYRRNKTRAWEVVNSYRWNPWPHLNNLADRNHPCK